jgi:transcriptional regulator with XRE-family HTH domain
MRQNRRFQVLELRRNSVTRREIATRLNVSSGLVSRYLKPMPNQKSEFALKLQQLIKNAPEDLDVSDINAAITRIRNNKPVQRYKALYPIVIRLIEEECCETNEDFQDELVKTRKEAFLILEEMVRFGILEKFAPARYRIRDDYTQR